jgi:hypothetical protein
VIWSDATLLQIAQKGNSSKKERKRVLRANVHFNQGAPLRPELLGVYMTGVRIMAAQRMEGHGLHFLFLLGDLHFFAFLGR